MMLFEEFMTPCVVMNKIHLSDGMGGFTTTWTEGAEFKAAIVKDSTMTAKIAEKQGVTEIYTITTNKGLGLEFNDVLKRLADGATFKVKSNSTDSQTPNSAGFEFEQVSAERVELT